MSTVRKVSIEGGIRRRCPLHETRVERFKGGGRNKQTFDQRAASRNPVSTELRTRI